MTTSHSSRTLSRKVSNQMSVIISHNDIIHHIEDCTICTRENVAPNGYSRTGDIEMMSRISQLHIH